MSDHFVVRDFSGRMAAVVAVNGALGPHERKVRKLGVVIVGCAHSGGEAGVADHEIGRRTVDGLSSREGARHLPQADRKMLGRGRQAPVAQLAQRLAVVARTDRAERPEEGPDTRPDLSCSSAAVDLTSLTISQRLVRTTRSQM